MSQRAGNNADEDRRRQFQRQQDRLKMMAPQSERSTVSAEAMIDSLLQKSDTFRKASNELPAWLQADSPSSFPFYNQIWEFVRVSDKMVDTQKISQLLLTGGLHPDILGYIWNLANKETLGQLNKQELFVVLALVGLAQSGCTFNSVSVLNMVPSPPIPRLLVPFQPNLVVPATVPAFNLPAVLPFSQTNPSHYGGVTSTQLNVNFNVSSTHQIHSSHNRSDNSEPILGNFQEPRLSTASALDDDFDDFQCVTAPATTREVTLIAPMESSPSLNTEKPAVATPLPSSSILKGPVDLDDFLSAQLDNASQLREQNTRENKEEKISDDFSDFQSAYSCDTSIVQPVKALPKLSSFIKVSPKSERKLRHLTKPESLKALPESKISSRNHVSTMPSISVVGASRSVGSRLANHALGTKGEKRNHQLSVKPIISTMPISTAKSEEEMFPKCFNSSFLLKETKIPSFDTDTDLNVKDQELTRQIEIPSVGTFKETSLPVTKKFDTSSPVKFSEPELLTMGEDKYGALRDLEIFRTESVESSSALHQPEEVVEDFGDFLSADLPSEKAAEAWSAWNSSVHVPDSNEFSLQPTQKSSEPAPKFVMDFTSISLDKIESTVPNNPLLLNSSETFNPETPPNVEQSDEFTDFKTSEEEISHSINLVDGLSDLQISSTPDKLQKSLDVEPVKAQPNYDIREFVEDDFGDFIAPAEDSLSVHLDDRTSIHSSAPSYDFGKSRQGSWSSLDFQGKQSRKSSIPSLNLTSEMESSVGERCLKCCFNLLKEAVDIFNGVSDKLALKEVFQTEQARNYVKYLGTVHSIASRVAVNGAGSSATSNEVSSLWREVRTIASEYSVPVEEPETVVASGSACFVCRGPTKTTDVDHNGVRYHVTCANLWINCIDSSLPCS